MKTMATHEGKTCKPQRIPLSAKLTATQIQNAYDEIADQYEKKTWFDQQMGKFWKWHVESARTFPCSQLAVTSPQWT